MLSSPTPKGPLLSWGLPCSSADKELSLAQQKSLLGPCSHGSDWLVLIIKYINDYSRYYYYQSFIFGETEAREVQFLAQGHAASGWQNQDLNLSPRSQAVDMLGIEISPRTQWTLTEIADLAPILRGRLLIKEVRGASLRSSEKRRRSRKGPWRGLCSVQKRKAALALEPPGHRGTSPLWGRWKCCPFISPRRGKASPP